MNSRRLIELLQKYIDNICSSPLNKKNKIEFVLINNNEIKEIKITRYKNLIKVYEQNMKVLQNFLKIIRQNDNVVEVYDFCNVFRVWKLFILYIITFKNGEKMLKRINELQKKIPLLSVLHDKWHNDIAKELESIPNMSSDDIQDWFLSTMLNITIDIFIDMFNDSKDKRIENYIKILQLFKKENDSLNTNNITDTDFNQMNRDLLLVQYNIINRDLMNSLKNNDEEKVSKINKYYTDLHQKNEILKKTNKQLIREIDLLQKQLKNNTKEFEKNNI